MTFRPDYSDEVLTVLVGPAEKKFVVHKATICRLSNFFKAACSRQWKEGQENLLRLPETDAEAFNVYAHWTYSDNLDMSLMTEPLSFTSPSYLHLGKIWILSNYFGNNALGNLVIDRLLQTMDRLLFHRVSTPTLQYLFTNLPVDSKIRRLFIDAVTATMNGTTFEKEGKSLPQEIVFELARRHAFGQSPQLPGPTFADRCKYHTHDEGEAECK